MTVETASPAPSDLPGAPAPADLVWFPGAKTWIRATADQTGRAPGLVEHVLVPGFASPYHLHRHEEESFQVTSGSIRFFSEGQTWVGDEGSLVFLPRALPHGSRVEGDSQARLLLLMPPGGFEGFVTDLCEPAPPSGPPDMGRLMQVAPQYGVDILGPLPE